jgi:hypothetical protein
MPQAKTESKDLLGRLRDAGEEALQRVGELPGGKRMLDAMNGLRDRIDELQVRMKRLDDLEKRVTALEQATKPAPRSRATTSRSSSSAKKS